MTQELKSDIKQVEAYDKRLKQISKRESLLKAKLERLKGA
jgi:hypothetical protein